MEDDNELHPLDILDAYGTAGSFIETRLARLKATADTDPQEIEFCEGMSGVLFAGIMLATSYLTDDVRVLASGDDEPDAVRMLS